MASDGKDLPDVSAFAAGNDTDAPRARVWIAEDAEAPTGFGRVMVSFETAAASADAEPAAVFSLAARIWGILSPLSPRIAGNIALNSKTAANDNVVWVSLDDDDSFGGALGCDVDVTTLANGTTVVAWIGDDGHAHAKAYAPPGGGDALDAQTSELNKVLADLGEAGTGQPGAGRVRLINTGSGLAALWVADFGLTAALIGKTFLLTHGEPGAESSAPQARWVAQDMASIPLPHDAAALAVQEKAGGGFTVTYQTESPAHETSPGESGGVADPGTAAVEVTTVELTVLKAAAPQADALASGDDGESPDVSGPAGSSTPPAEPSAPALDIGTAAVTAPVDGTGFGGAPADLPGIAVIGHGDGIPQNAPQVVALQGGGAALLFQQPGSAPGKTALILTPLDANGQPIMGPDGSPLVTVVTSDAVTSDPDNPNLDLAPAFAPADGGTAIVWAEVKDVDGHPAVEVKVQLFDSGCEARSEAPATVAVSGGKLSDFAVAEWHGKHEHHGDEDSHHDADAGGAAMAGAGPDVPVVAAEAASDQPASAAAQPEAEPAEVSALVAVLWVQDANDDGYGQIMGQRFGLEGAADGETSGAHLVAMGADGTSGDGHDEAFAIADQDAEGEAAAVGRGLVLAQAGEDELVVGWVEETDPGSGIEVVDGVVLSASGGSALLSFDLTGLMPNGILRGTDPSIRATDHGDIVIGWLQEGHGKDHYEAAAAVYKALDPGQWLVPSEAVILSVFDEKPKSVVFTVSGGDDPAITVSWTEDGDIEGQTFDLDGGLVSDFSHHGAHTEAGSSDTAALSVAASASGLIVVYSEASKDGDMALSAVVVPLADTGGTQGPGEGSSPGPDVVTAALVVPEDDGGIALAAPLLHSDQGPDPEQGHDSGEGQDADCGGDGDEHARLTEDDDIATAYAVADSDNDLIRFVDNDWSGSNSGPGSGSGHGSGSGSGHGSGKCGDDGDWGGDNSGPGERNTSGEDSFHFVSGYGNEIAEYHDEDDLFDDATPDDPMAAAFDALHFANALSDAGNMEVLTFDASNIVHIRDFTDM